MVAALAQPLTSKLTAPLVDSVADFLRDNVFGPFMAAFDKTLGEKLCELADAIDAALADADQAGYARGQADAEREFNVKLAGKDAQIMALEAEISHLRTGQLWSTLGAGAAGAAFGILTGAHLGD